MTQAALQLMQELLAKNAATGKSEFDPFELLGTPETLLDELEHSGFITRSNTIRRKIVLTELALYGEPGLHTADERDHKRRVPKKAHSSQVDHDIGKKTLHWNIAGVIVAAIAGIVIPFVIWWLSHVWP